MTKKHSLLESLMIILSVLVLVFLVFRGLVLVESVIQGVPENELNDLLATLQNFPNKNFVELVNGSYKLFGLGILIALFSIMNFAVKTLHTEFHAIYTIYKSKKPSSEIKDIQQA